MKPWTQTASGGMFFPLEPRIEDIKLSDCIISLSREPRFLGGTVRPYSVLEHTLLTNLLCDIDNIVEHNANRLLTGDSQTAEVPVKQIQYKMMFHDFSEAYLKDLPRPIKVGCPLGEEYVKVESVIQNLIYEKVGIDSNFDVEGEKRYDFLALYYEYLHLMMKNNEIFKDFERDRINPEIRLFYSSIPYREWRKYEEFDEFFVYKLFCTIEDMYLNEIYPQFEYHDWRLPVVPTAEQHKSYGQYVVKFFLKSAYYDEIIRIQEIYDPRAHDKSYISQYRTYEKRIQLDYVAALTHIAVSLHSSGFFDEESMNSMLQTCCDIINMNAVK